MTADQSFDPDKIVQARKILEHNGLECCLDLLLLEHGYVMAAYHPQRRDGFLLEPADINHVLHYGVVALDPFDDGKPRWKRDGLSAATTMQRYAEAVMARVCWEMRSAPAGTRNATLNKCAFVLGQYLNWQVYTYGDASQALLEAALEAGIRGGEREAKATIRSGLNAGFKRPKELLSRQPSTRQDYLKKRWVQR